MYNEAVKYHVWLGVFPLFGDYPDMYPCEFSEHEMGDMEKYSRYLESLIPYMRSVCEYYEVVTSIVPPNEN
jgi:hypothetical protein